MRSTRAATGSTRKASRINLRLYYPNTDDNYPILSGGTFATRRLGIKNLKDVP